MLLVADDLLCGLWEGKMERTFVWLQSDICVLSLSLYYLFEHNGRLVHLPYLWTVKRQRVKHVSQDDRASEFARFLIEYCDCVSLSLITQFSAPPHRFRWSNTRAATTSEIQRCNGCYSRTKSFAGNKVIFFSWS